MKPVKKTKWKMSDWANLAQITSVPLMVLLWFATRDDAVKFWKRWSWLIFLVLLCLGLFRAWRLGYFDRIWGGLLASVNITLKTLHQWERGFALSFIGLLLGLAGMVFATYPTFFRNPKLIVELVSKATLFDAKDFRGVGLFYRGIELGTNQNLAELLVKVSNEGNAPLQESAYDAPLGLEIGGGRIVEDSLAAFSNDYLAHNTRLMTTSNQVTFSRVMLQPHDSFTARLLVLYASETNLTLRTTGRVMGVREIAFKNPG